MDDFLNKNGWGHATRTPITPDWSPRQYWRLANPDGSKAVLLKGPAQEIPGHGLADFVRYTERFAALGLSTPQVYAADLPANLLLIEDFGDTPIDTPAIEPEGYAAAVDVLATLRGADTAGLTRYKDGYIYKKLALYSDDPAWLRAWEEAEAALPPCPHVFSHMDYKAGNLHWLPARTGNGRLGILDFQAAQNAPFVYDIVNLLEDARRNVPEPLKTGLKARFKQGLPAQWQPLFDDWYVLMAAQFHARVLGQIRGNAAVAADIAPRLEAYLGPELAHPALAPVLKCQPIQNWLEKRI